MLGVLDAQRLFAEVFVGRFPVQNQRVAIRRIGRRLENFDHRGGRVHLDAELRGRARRRGRVAQSRPADGDEFQTVFPFDFLVEARVEHHPQRAFGPRVRTPADPRPAVVPRHIQVDFRDSRGAAFELVIEIEPRRLRQGGARRLRIGGGGKRHRRAAGDRDGRRPRTHRDRLLRVGLNRLNQRLHWRRRENRLGVHRDNERRGHGAGFAEARQRRGRERVAHLDDGVRRHRRHVHVRRLRPRFRDFLVRTAHVPREILGHDLHDHRAGDLRLEFRAPLGDAPLRGGLPVGFRPGECPVEKLCTRIVRELVFDRPLGRDIFPVPRCRNHAHDRWRGIDHQFLRRRHAAHIDRLGRAFEEHELHAEVVQTVGLGGECEFFLRRGDRLHHLPGLTLVARDEQPGLLDVLLPLGLVVHPELVAAHFRHLEILGVRQRRLTQRGGQSEQGQSGDVHEHSPNDGASFRAESWKLYRLRRAWDWRKLMEVGND